MILVIDAGNTRVKWGVFDRSGLLTAQGAVETAQLEQLAGQSQAWAGCRRVAVSNVAGPLVEDKLRALFSTLGLPALWIKAEAAACGVNNGYASPQQLGTDRWAALVAAWHHYREPCIVATAGTALTVDALSAQGEFLGGLIVPGLQLMQASLASGTAGLPRTAGQWCEYPDNTADAIYSGALNAMAGAVERMCSRLEERAGRFPRCLLAGGDAPKLATALHIASEITEDLVLQGLLLIEREHP